MTDKETATATLTEFFTHIGGRKPRIEDAWDDYKLVSAYKHVGKRHHRVVALTSDISLDTVNVTVYDFRANAKREVVLRVESLPEMSAKFVLEAIDAYEAEMNAA